MHSLANATHRDAVRFRLAALQENDRAAWGVMTAGEMVCHLRGAFRIAFGEGNADSTPEREPSYTLKLAALWMPVRWPQHVETLPSLKRGTAEVTPGNFMEDRAELLKAVERFCGPEPLQRDHPIFGPMSLRDWMRWGFLHTDHHLRQFGR